MGAPSQGQLNFVRPAPVLLRPQAIRSLPHLAEPCTRCGFDFLMPSKPRGLRDEFLEVIGIPLYRSHKCEARYARVGRRNIRTQPRQSRTHAVALAAIVMGLLICAGLALYVQKVAHRWPF